MVAMSRLLKARDGLSVAAAALTAAIILALLAAPRAQQPVTGTGTAPKTLIPVAASSVAENPDAFYGQYVTMSASVEQSLSKLVFSVDQDRSKSTGKEVLVLARMLVGAVNPNTPITVIGEIVRVDPLELASKANYTLDLAPDLIEKWRGRPAILAATVINSSGVDMTRRLPPPMTAEEETHSVTMKSVGAANGALRKAIEGSDTPLAREQAAVLLKAFQDTERFWKARAKTDAVGWAQDAHKTVAAIDTAAAGGKWEDAKMSAATLGSTCQSCHGVYRERFDDGSYRIKR